MSDQLVFLPARYLLLTWVVVYGLAIELGNYQSALRCTICLLSDNRRLPQYPFSLHAARTIFNQIIFSAATFEFQTSINLTTSTTFGEPLHCFNSWFVQEQNVTCTEWHLLEVGFLYEIVFSPVVTCLPCMHLMIKDYLMVLHLLRGGNKDEKLKRWLSCHTLGNMCNGKRLETIFHGHLFWHFLGTPYFDRTILHLCDGKCLETEGSPSKENFCSTGMLPNM